MAKDIIIKGARVNNLKNVDLTIPRDKLTVLTGLSGSGKSSLAFDTLYAEGQRRFVESLSSYARQFLGQMDKPDVDSIEGLSPAISIDQKTTSKNPRSTVGTVTEIYDYLRLLCTPACGVPHCPVCGKEIKQQTVDSDRRQHPRDAGGHALSWYSPPSCANAKGDARKGACRRAAAAATPACAWTAVSTTSRRRSSWTRTSSTRWRSWLTAWSAAPTRTPASRDSVETAVALTGGLVRIVTVPREEGTAEEERDYSLRTTPARNTASAIERAGAAHVLLQQPRTAPARAARAWAR